MPRSKGGKATHTRRPLRLLYRDKKLETLFVAVAGIGTKRPSNWTDEAGKLWLARVQAPSIGLFSYEHDISNSDTDLWPSLIEHGQHLLMSIVTLVDRTAGTEPAHPSWPSWLTILQLRNCAILLVGHSLGGFIVKETLRLAYERTEQQYNSFKKSLAGVILLGTPHSISEVEEKWQNVALLPHLAGLGLKAPSLEHENIKKLAQSSLAFDQSEVVCPILTVCEARETRLKHLFGSRRVKLVEQDFARTGSREEYIVVVDCDHKDLCNVGNEAEVRNFIATALEVSRLRISSGSPQSGTEADELDEPAYDLIDTISTPRTSPDTVPASAISSGLGFELIPIMSNLKLDGVKLPCYSVPVARNKDFYGRQNILDQIDQFFSAPGISHREDGDPSRSFALCGPGGMGKTQIATEYVHRCKASNAFDAIFWVYADKPSKISDGISQIAVSLGLVPAESKEALDPVITTNLAKEWLSNPARFSNFADEKRKRQPTWLLILDNANDIRVLERFWPIGGPGCLLVTSRDPLAKDPSVLADSGHDIESFSPQESGEMLERLTRRKGNGPAIGDRLGGLPLALAQMAGVIIRNHMSFQDFLDTWDENKEHSELLGYDHKLGQSDGYDKNLSTAWAVESLRHGKLLLEVISFFDPDSIQEVILKQFSTVELVQYPNTHGAYLKARRELLQTSLLAKDRTEKNVSVHRMVQDVTRSKMGKEQYQNIFAAALHLLAQKWPYAAFGWRHTVARWRMCEELFPHVLSLNGYGSRLMQACDNTSIKIEYCKLMNDAGWYYHETGRFVESQALIEHAQSVAEAAQSAVSHVRKESGTEKDTAQQLITLLAETHHNLGCIGTESNQPKFALFHFRKFNEMTIAEIDRQRLKTDKRLAISWNELGNAFMMNKMWFDGERCYKKCLQVAQQMPNFAPAQFSFPYVNLGLAYWITERLSEAKQTLEEGLRHRVAAYGQDDHESFITGRFLYALGNVAASNGDLGESLSYHERALRQFLSTIGKNHHHTGDIHIKVGEHHLRSGNLNEAAIHFDEALRIFNEHAIFRPELTRATFWKSRLLKASGRVEEARKVKDKSVEMYFDVTLGAVQDIIEPSLADFDGIVAFWSQ